MTGITAEVSWRISEVQRMVSRYYPPDLFLASCFSLSLHRYPTPAFSPQKENAPSHAGLTRTPGKHAAIREIMKGRQGKRLQLFQQQPGRETSLMMDTVQQEEQAIEESPNTNTFKCSPVSPYPVLTKAVTFEEEVVFEHEDGESELDHSPSFWAMVGGEGEQWNTQELLGASFMSITPERNNHHLLNDDVEPNVSWQEEGSETRQDAALSFSGKDLLASHLFSPTPTAGVNAKIGNLSSSNDSESTENISIHSFQPSELTSTPIRDCPDSTTSEKPLRSTSSPFSTFKQNSTSVELFEANFYVQKIEALEQQLVQAEQRADTEAAKRLEAEHRVQELSLPRIPTGAKTPAPSVSAKSFSSKSYRSTPLTPSNSTSALPESMWERNQTLVKEVRFADQTCVELSAQKLALENQVAQLEENLSQLANKNETLKQAIAEANRARADAEAVSLRTAQRAKGEEKDMDSVEEWRESPVQLPTDRRPLREELDRITERLATDLDGISPTVEDKQAAGEVLESDGGEDSTDSSSDRAKNEVLEKALKESQDQVQTQLADLENLRAEIGSLQSQLILERSAAKNAVKRIVQEVNAQAEALGENVIDRLGETEARLGVLAEAVFWMEDELFIDVEEEDSRSDVSADVNDNEPGLHATFSNQNQSDDLVLMEEARSSKQEGIGIVRNSSRVAYNESGLLQRSEASESMSSGAQGMSDLSESTNIDHSGNDEKLLHHLQWLSSPDAVQETPFSCPDAFNEDDSKSRAKSAKKNKANQPLIRDGSAGPLDGTAVADGAGTGPESPERHESGEAGTLNIRFESLQRQTEQVEQQLARKGIFPKGPRSPFTSRPRPQPTEQSEGLFEQLSTVRKEKELADLELQNVIASFNENKAALDSLAKECDGFRNDTAALLAENENLKVAKTQLEQKVSQLTLGLISADTVAKEFESLKTTHQLVKDRLRESLAEREQALLDQKNLEAANASLEKVASHLEDEILSAEAVTKELEESRKKAAAEAAIYREKWSSLTSHCEKMKEQLAALEAVEKQSKYLGSRLESKQAEAENLAKELSHMEGLVDNYKSETLVLQEMNAVQRGDLEAAYSERKQLEALLESKHAEADTLAKELSHMERLANKHKFEASDLREKNEVLSGKCERLRAYIRKLTKKCDEWESFHHRESHVLQHLKATLDRTRHEACVLAERYKQSDQLYSAEKAKACDLQYELDAVATELVNAGPS